MRDSVHPPRLVDRRLLLSVAAACVAFGAGYWVSGWPTRGHSTPIVDGRCSEYASPPARTFPMDNNLVLHVLENQDYVWLCVPLPEGSVGMLDLRIESPGLERPLNLHVSAQLGEWPEGETDLVPTGPESPLWWNHQGWTANWLGLHGMSPDGKRPVFASAPAREMQLSKERFGRPPWKLSFAFYQLRAKDGTLYDVTSPAKGVLTMTPASTF